MIGSQLREPPGRCVFQLAALARALAKRRSFVFHWSVGMSTSPSRRDMFCGLFAAGLAWLGVRKAAAAAPAPAVVAPQPAIVPVTTLRYSHGGLSSICTYTYDASDRLCSVQDGLNPVTYIEYVNVTGKRAAQPPRDEPTVPKKTDFPSQMPDGRRGSYDAQP
jgi:hypothetical protein